jgi:hypothetical protein
MIDKTSLQKGSSETHNNKNVQEEVLVAEVTNDSPALIVKSLNNLLSNVLPRVEKEKLSRSESCV